MKQTRWGFFPSFAMAWNVDQEDFFKGDIFDSLKLRLGYGQVGNVNGLGDYKFLTRYTCTCGVKSLKRIKI